MLLNGFHSIKHFSIPFHHDDCNPLMMWVIFSPRVETCLSCCCLHWQQQQQQQQQQQLYWPLHLTEIKLTWCCWHHLLSQMMSMYSYLWLRYPVCNASFQQMTWAILPCSYIVRTFQKLISEVVLALKAPVDSGFLSASTTVSRSNLITCRVSDVFILSIHCCPWHWFRRLVLYRWCM